MTAEAVVLNKTAVAMAADSAVTISGGRNQMLKTFDTANKLFELIKGQPVGIMTFANAEINGTPWESAIKSFRSESSGLVLPHLRDYSDAFIAFLKDSTFALSEDSDSYTFRQLGYQTCLHMAQYLKERIPDCMTTSGRLVKSKAQQLMVESILHVKSIVDELPLAPWADELPVEVLRDRYHADALELFDSVFPELPVLKRDRESAVATMLEFCRRAAPAPSESGVVIAGFGSREVFPSLRSIRIRGRLAGVVLAYNEDEVRISQQHPGDVRTFAQDEIAWGYLTGINSVMRNEIMDYWADWIGSNSEQRLLELLKENGVRLAQRTLDNICQSSTSALQQAFETFLSHMQDHQNRTFRDPILLSIPFLPRSELAMLAESLVNLTSLWQRVSIESAQTVGGEIDVGLVSLGDGFVWISRKHYFSTDLNPAWPLTHAGMIPRATTTRSQHDDNHS